MLAVVLSVELRLPKMLERGPDILTDLGRSGAALILGEHTGEQGWPRLLKRCRAGPRAEESTNLISLDARKLDLLPAVDVAMSSFSRRRANNGISAPFDLCGNDVTPNLFE
jgi:hypothetical protein